MLVLELCSSPSPLMYLIAESPTEAMFFHFSRRSRHILILSLLPSNQSWSIVFIDWSQSMRSKFVPLTLKLFTINAYPRFTIYVKFPLPLSLYVFLVGWIIILSVLQASVWGGYPGTCSRSQGCQGADQDLNPGLFPPEGCFCTV